MAKHGSLTVMPYKEPDWRENKRVYKVTVTAREYSHVGFLDTSVIKELLSAKTKTQDDLADFHVNVKELLDEGK